MFGIIKKGIALAALALAAGGVSAKEGALHGFTVADKDFTLPVPEGYCLPSGATVAVAEMVASLDSLNLTHATLDRCGSFGVDYIHVKSPRQAQIIPLPRAAFLPLMAKTLEGEMGKRLMDEAMKKAGRDIAEGTDNAVTLDSTAPRFDGHDDVCAYGIVSGKVQSEAGVVDMRGVVCMTLIAERFMTVNAYAHADSGTTEAQLKARARAVALTIAEAR